MTPSPAPAVRPSPSHWLRHGLVVALLMLLSRADWVLSSLYHGDQTPAGILMACVVLAAASMTLLAGLALCLPNRVAELALRTITVAVAIYVVQPAIRALPLLPAELTGLHKLGLAGGTLLLAGLAAFFLSPALWRRLQVALLAGGLLFVTFPMLAAQMTAPVQVKGPAQAVPHTATLVLLLDELNADAAPQVAAAIQQAGGSPTTRLVRAVGDSTITVIPEMFGAPHMPQARVCTPTAVCDQRGVFDFSRLRLDAADRFHIVGFHHPYCSAQGLASCTQLAPPARPPVSSLLCSFGRLIPGRQASDCDWFAPDDWQDFRQRLRAAAFASPFWETGGTLYAHLPFPHPPGRLPSANLAADYQDNLALAAQLAADAWKQGQQRFGAGFRLIVTSDHPLRPSLWCRHAKYRQTGCEVAATAHPGQVPYIVADTLPGESPAPADNGHVFVLPRTHSPH